MDRGDGDAPVPFVQSESEVFGGGLMLSIAPVFGRSGFRHALSPCGGSLWVPTRANLARVGTQ
eukprot:15191843-Heterocapsa_arctica.AAC.1